MVNGVLVDQDWAPIDILMRRSTDNGATWDAPRVIVDHRTFESMGVTHEGGHSTINNFTTIADRSGAVHALFCVNYARCYHMRSLDDGVSFSEVVDITHAFEALRAKYDWNVIAVGPGHGIQLSGGRLIASVWLSTGGKHHRPSAVASIVSDDGGASWQCGDIVGLHGGEFINPSETVLAELSDGRVYFNIRSESVRHRRLVSISPNGTSKWTSPVFDDALIDPVCMGSIIRVSGDRPRIVFACPAPHDLSQQWYGCLYERENLTLYMSSDDCRTWGAKRTLEKGYAGYSDLAYTNDGHILCFYECDRVDGRLADDRYCTLARFSPEWIDGTNDV
ncbi:MAG: sialidase family protein [Spirochaetota bacterium]